MNSQTKFSAKRFGKMPIPGYLDRYPAKMVAHLADQLIDKYCARGERVLDPFCGSGAVLTAAQRRECEPVGFDLNPFAVLMSRVKLEGFVANEANELVQEAISISNTGRFCFPVCWDNKNYWFTSLTLKKYEQLRFAMQQMQLNRSRSGRAVLLAYALSIRRCSRADQRSPKPFISKTARSSRQGKHYDPYAEIQQILTKLAESYGVVRKFDGRVFQLDIRSGIVLPKFPEPFSVVVTSPPYLNAQDYFRNFKLELHFLEGLLSFQVEKLRHRFIGTERGDLLAGIPSEERLRNRDLLPELIELERTHRFQAAVAHRYFSDMRKSIRTIRTQLARPSKFILVCGDNLMGGIRIRTWKVLDSLVLDEGFHLTERFGDNIERRYVPPQRQGHKGLIKQEKVSAYCLHA